MAVHAPRSFQHLKALVGGGGGGGGGGAKYEQVKSNPRKQTPN
jgi:hypothetical protein